MKLNLAMKALTIETGFPTNIQIINNKMPRPTSIFWLFQDANPLGEIILGTAADKFSVDSQPLAGECSFTLHTPFRDFPLVADSVEDKNWFQCLHEPVAPHTN